LTILKKTTLFVFGLFTIMSGSVVIGTDVLFVYADTNLFYGSSEFENLVTLIPGRPTVFELKVQYTDGPDILRGVTPVFLVYPENASSYVHIDSEYIQSLTRNELGRIHNVVLVDPITPHQQIFLNVHFVGVDRFGNQFESGWIDSIMIALSPQEPPIIPPPMGKIISDLAPLKQLKAGIRADDVVCKEGFVLAIKASNGNPTCVTPETKAKLLTRGWT
jgi:hypothetical protein